MFNQLLRHGTRPTLPWHDGQRRMVRGATRISPKHRVSLIARLKSSLGFVKLAVSLGITLVLLISAYKLGGNIWAYLNQPIAKVKVLGELNYVDVNNLEKRLEPIVATGFLSLDIGRLRQNLEQAPWVSHVEVERVWPDQVRIRLFTKHPIARWGTHSLLNNTGDSFVTKDVEKYQSLPLLNGPDYAQQQVMQQYQVLSQLLRPLELTISSLSLNDRGSWSLTTHTGLELRLGNDELLTKMKRFTKAYHAQLKDKMDNIARIDLRYPNGLAVVWRDPSLEISTKMVANH